MGLRRLRMLLPSRKPKVIAYDDEEYDVAQVYPEAQPANIYQAQQLASFSGSIGTSGSELATVTVPEPGDFLPYQPGLLVGFKRATGYNNTLYIDVYVNDELVGTYTTKLQSIIIIPSPSSGAWIKSFGVSGLQSGDEVKFVGRTNTSTATVVMEFYSSYTIPSDAKPVVLPYNPGKPAEMPPPKRVSTSWVPVIRLRVHDNNAPVAAYGESPGCGRVATGGRGGTRVYLCGSGGRIVFEPVYNTIKGINGGRVLRLRSLSVEPEAVLRAYKISKRGIGVVTPFPGVGMVQLAYSAGGSLVFDEYSNAFAILFTGDVYVIAKPIADIPVEINVW